jgi:hypothetical protein
MQKVVACAMMIAFCHHKFRFYACALIEFMWILFSSLFFFFMLIAMLLGISNLNFVFTGYLSLGRYNIEHHDDAKALQHCAA